MNTDSKDRYSDMDNQVRKIVGRDVSSTSFEYHLIKLMLLIEQELQDKDLVEEMTDEMILAIRDLRTWFQKPWEDKSTKPYYSND